MSWKRRSRNESIALYRTEMDVGRWKLCKDLDQKDIPINHMKEEER